MGILSNSKNNKSRSSLRDKIAKVGFVGEAVSGGALSSQSRGDSIKISAFSNRHKRNFEKKEPCKGRCKCPINLKDYGVDF